MIKEANQYWDAMRAKANLGAPNVGALAGDADGDRGLSSQFDGAEDERLRVTRTNSTGIKR